MHAQKTLTQADVTSAAPQAHEWTLWDGALPGFGLRIRPSGNRVFVFVYRLKGVGRDGTRRRHTIGTPAALSVKQARALAKDVAHEVAKGNDPAAAMRIRRAQLAATNNTVASIAEIFIERYAKPRNRTWRESRRILDYYVKSRWGKRTLTSLRRFDVVTLLDEIEDKHGAVTADHVLAQIRKMFNWYALRDDAFISPVVPGMARTRPRDRARSRVLTDDELRAVWNATLGMIGPFGPLVRLLLLTAQRREEVGGAQWNEMHDGLWTIPPERSKGKRPQLVPLSQMAQAELTALPRFQIDGIDCQHVFTYSGRRGFNSYSEAKANLDKASGVTGWVLHDLRRTARTLMTRVGVRPDIAERVLGHVIPGVAGVYDRHVYLVEKRQALEALSAEIIRIVNKTENDAVPLPAAAA